MPRPRRKGAGGLVGRQVRWRESGSNPRPLGAVSFSNCGRAKREWKERTARATWALSRVRSPRFPLLQDWEGLSREGLAARGSSARATSCCASKGGRREREREIERVCRAGAPAWLFFATKKPVAGGVRTPKPSPNPPSRKAIGSAKPNRSVSLAAQRGRSLQGGADLVAPPVCLGMALFALARCPDTRARQCPALPSPFCKPSGSWQDAFCLCTIGASGRLWARLAACFLLHFI